MQSLYKSCYELDNRCYEEYNLTEDILMEHASHGMADYIKKHFPPQSSILVVCGVGNNGADGIVLGRLLQDEYDVKLFIPFEVKSVMAKKQLERVELLEVEILETLEDADIIVDALFGAGLSRELNEETQRLIVQLQNLKGFKIACDIPSGIDVDGNPSPVAFTADITITMGALKESLYSDKAKEFVGDILRVNLGLSHAKYTEGFETDTFLLEEKDLILPDRDSLKNTHKGDFGHLGIIVGNKEGAGIMSGLAGLRFGVGLVTLIGNIKSSLNISLMQSVTVPPKVTAIALGMGYGDDFENELLDGVVESKLPIILDADILKNEIVSEFLEQENREIVLTPHPREFVALWNMTIDEPIDIDMLQSSRFEKVREFCTLFPNVTLLLKGANTVIGYREMLMINPYGSSKLSKAGSGDVLSGLIGALLAQGRCGFESAIGGSLALTSVAKIYKDNSYSMLPTDLIDNIGKI